jgi:CheY-like chemotaxis protein
VILPTGRDKDVSPRDATEGVAVECQQSVLIVDASDETREVLQTALERRGVRILSANRAAPGLELARRHHPDLIVLDLEVDGPAAANLSATFAEQSRSDSAGLVLLGSLRRGTPPASGEFVAKPYHYGSLIRKIEELLVAHRH